jgi:hypothetical protein
MQVCLHEVSYDINIVETGLGLGLGNINQGNYVLVIEEFLDNGHIWYLEVLSLSQYALHL